MNRTTDLFVLGATPGGIAAAVRAAREGLDVVLATYNAHVGGMTASGLSQTDAQIVRERAPLKDEFFARVAEHYREEYGPDSPQFEASDDGYVPEPHVAEAVFEDLLEEAGVDVRREQYLADVTRAGSELHAVRLRPRKASDVGYGTLDREAEALTVRADTFVDATYEGDLAATAGCASRIGREAREEYDEAHAGRIYTYEGTKLAPGNTGVGDDAIQAYNYRVTVTDDPENRVLPEKPPNYDRSEYSAFFEKRDERNEFWTAWSIAEAPTERLAHDQCGDYLDADFETVAEEGLTGVFRLTDAPNRKADLNTADIPGAVEEYPEADPETRQEIARRHREHALGLLYFLQNDEEIPEAARERAREWGLPADEFEDTGNFPWQLYVREARRLVGKYVFTENDAELAAGIERAPIHRDAVATAEYDMDSHECRPVRRPGSRGEGAFNLYDVTVPSQIPYGTILPEEYDNLLVPVAVSATHVGFATVRMEPTWMHLGEIAGLSAALGDEREVAPADLDVTELQDALLDRGGMLALFSDTDMSDDEPWVPAVQRCATRGFFYTYDARPTDTLDHVTAREWAETTAVWADGKRDPTAHARRLAEAHRPIARGETETEDTSAGKFLALLGDAFDRRGLDADPVTALETVSVGTDAALTRGEACLIADEALWNHRITDR